MRKAGGMVAGKFPLEASGGIRSTTLLKLPASGVDYASSGGLTHSASTLDVTLEIEI